MRALPVPQDTIDLLVTAILISSPAITPPTRERSIVAGGIPPAIVLAGADRIGQQLWDENYASVSLVNHRLIPAPRYTWRPVAELMGAQVDTEQILQIERSRLYLEEVSCHHDGWDGSYARKHLTRLGHSIDNRLYFHPRELSPEHAGVVEFAGLSRAADEWTRKIGFRNSLAATAAAHQIREERSS